MTEHNIYFGGWALDTDKDQLLQRSSEHFSLTAPFMIHA